MYITLFAILMAILGNYGTNQSAIDKNQSSVLGYDPPTCSEFCVFDENGGETSHIPPIIP